MLKTDNLMNANFHKKYNLYFVYFKIILNTIFYPVIFGNTINIYRTVSKKTFMPL